MGRKREGQADLMLSNNSCPAGRGQRCHFWGKQRKCGLWTATIYSEIAFHLPGSKFFKFMKHRQSSVCPRLLMCTRPAQLMPVATGASDSKQLMGAAGGRFRECADRCSRPRLQLRCMFFNKHGV